MPPKSLTYSQQLEFCYILQNFMDYAIGIDLGGTNIKFLVTDKNGNVLDQKWYPSDAPSNKDSWSQKIKNFVNQIESDRKRPARWLGISAPGMASKDHRKIISLPGRLKGLEYLDWTQFLEKKEPIPVLNDAHAAFYGESWKGAAKNYKNVILLTLGTGVGGAFSINGQLQKGITGRAGHFGHTCLNPDGPLDIKNSPGSIELMIGECTIKERTHGRFSSTKDLVAAHLAGDTMASQIWLRSIYHLACAIASFINILDPEVIIIGGGISDAGDALLEPLAKYMDKVEWRPEGHRVPICLAQLGNQAGALGAIHYAMTHTQALSACNC